MAKPQKNQVYVLKLRTGYLAQHNWDLKLDLNVIRKDPQMVVSLGSSQVLRWMEQIQGRQNDDLIASSIKREIKSAKKNKANRQRVSELYDQLYKTQFQQDYIMIVMDSVKDYRRARKGFSVTVDGVTVKYRRLFGTTGSIKKSTIIFVNENIHEELMRRINNGRDQSKPIVPAKLNAYMALSCSASIKVSWPRMIVVNDAVTCFKNDVLLVDDSDISRLEPVVSYIKDKEIEYNITDGFGLMTPQMSITWSEELNEGTDEPLSGVNVRSSFLKGMLFTVDFIKFAEEVAHTYKIIDAYGVERDVRDADAIITTSMLKLWDSYPSYESYYENCMKNNYDFAVAKTTAHKLRNTHTLNYQYIQDFKLSGEQINRLISPTVQKIKNILGLNWVDLILYTCGENLDESNVLFLEPMFKSILANPELINDPYVRSRVSRMIQKRIKTAKIGVIDVEGDYAILGNDPYAFLQAMFGMTVTGLLGAGECYHRYWTDKDVDEIVVFRAPMTSINNVCKMRVVSSDEMDKWFGYIKTCCLINSWDTTAIRLDGADYDSDMVFSTNNDVLLEAFEYKPTLMCAQSSASKVVPTEADFIRSEVNGFGDTIGSVTNRATNMISLRESFDVNSEEHKRLSYRINTMMNYQQNAIDRIKGIIARPIPRYWLYPKDSAPENGDSEEILANKAIDRRIAVEKKPWFFVYRYPSLKAETDKYVKQVNSNCKIRFNKSLQDLINAYELSEEEAVFLEYYYKYLPVDMSPGTINRICWAIESEFKTTNVLSNAEFDYRILKTDSPYSAEDYEMIKKSYDEYTSKVQLIKRQVRQTENADEEISSDINRLKSVFRAECEKLCLSDEDLANIVVDICYTSDKEKGFAWDMAGEKIFRNVLKNSGSILRIPISTENGDVLFNGLRFAVIEKQTRSGDDDYI